MSNENPESKKVILGLLVGAALGATACYLFKASREQKTPILHKIGKTICEVGEMLEHFDVKNSGNVVKEAQKNFPKANDLVDNLLNWFSNGMQLWQKLKKGD